MPCRQWLSVLPVPPGRSPGDRRRVTGFRPLGRNGGHERRGGGQGSCSRRDAIACLPVGEPRRLAMASPPDASPEHRDVVDRQSRKFPAELQGFVDRRDLQRAACGGRPHHQGLREHVLAAHQKNCTPGSHRHRCAGRRGPGAVERVPPSAGFSRRRLAMERLVRRQRVPDWRHRAARCEDPAGRARRCHLGATAAARQVTT
jgi:hypothetical protein